MAQIPKLSWPIRLAALIVAGGLSCYIVVAYSFGARFSREVGFWMKMTSAPPPPPEFKNVAGVVPVMLLPEKKN